MLSGAVLLGGSLLAGCEEKDEFANYPDTPVDVLYNRGMDDLIGGDADTAVKFFDEVERQHPYSPWATRAQLMSAYTLYLANKYDDAIESLDRFIQLHPGNKELFEYAYYLKAICYYEQISDVERDQKMTSLALDSLRAVVQRFPESKYARDAQLKIDLALDHLAGKHMAIGRYYQSQKEFLAAINRFRRVIETYQTTTHVPEALHRLVECYLALGIVQEAQATAAVLGYNYPGSKWYEDSYKLLTSDHLRPAQDDDSWISKAWGSVT
ncbi:MAG TPA: outer membrane protein assembly factor BamD [Kiloniellaceae bacterium]|nr:outer membrane protein assembly factor BamD [Kiloniellaceae bacterium]